MAKILLRPPAGRWAQRSHGCGQLNIYSISPVAILDVARVWPVNEGGRYGVGPGLRLSLVNANLSFGYAFNPRRGGPEKAGAVFFKLDITSLF